MTVSENPERTYFLRGLNPINCMTLQRGLLRGESFTPLYTIKTSHNLSPIMNQIGAVLAERMNRCINNKLMLSLEQAQKAADTQNKRLNIDTPEFSMRLPMESGLPIREGQTMASHLRSEAHRSLQQFGINCEVDVELRRDPCPCPIVRGPHTVLNFNHVNLCELQTQIGRDDGSAYPALAGYESSLLMVGMDVNEILHRIHSSLSQTVFVRKESVPGTIHWKPSSEPSSVNCGYVAGSQDFYMIVKSRQVNIVPVSGYPDVFSISEYIKETFGRTLRTTGITGFYLSCGNTAGIFTQLF